MYLFLIYLLFLFLNVTRSFYLDKIYLVSLIDFNRADNTIRFIVNDKFIYELSSFDLEKSNLIKQDYLPFKVSSIVHENFFNKTTNQLELLNLKISTESNKIHLLNKINSDEIFSLSYVKLFRKPIRDSNKIRGLYFNSKGQEITLFWNLHYYTEKNLDINKALNCKFINNR